MHHPERRFIFFISFLTSMNGETIKALWKTYNPLEVLTCHFISVQEQKKTILPQTPNVTWPKDLKLTSSSSKLKAGHAQSWSPESSCIWAACIKSASSKKLLQLDQCAYRKRIKEWEIWESEKLHTRTNHQSARTGKRRFKWIWI